MTSYTALIGIFALCLSNARAQEWPRYEASVNYTFTHFSTDVGAPPLNANGGNFEFAFNFNKWVSGVGEFGAIRLSSFADDTDFPGSGPERDTMLTYMAGPRLTFRRRRITPYLQTLFGGASVLGSSVIPNRQETGFAMTAGGGLEVEVNRHVSLRALQVEYFSTLLDNLRLEGDKWQINLRVSAGVIFTFGREKPHPKQVPTVCPDGSVIPADQTCPATKPSGRGHE
jgi:opacity protein-like surface antigen